MTSHPQPKQGSIEELPKHHFFPNNLVSEERCKYLHPSRTEPRRSQN